MIHQSMPRVIIKNGLIVDDPWGEFMAGEWRYTGIKDGDNLEYSDRPSNVDRWIFYIIPKRD